MALLKRTKKATKAKATKATKKVEKEVVKTEPTNQVIETDFNQELVELYKNNYIMEEEGIGADDEQPFDTQTTFESEDDFDAIYGEGCVIDDDTN